MNAREDGFTLVELMVVILIIAILIAIAIPTFLGARTRAQDRAAQSELRNTLTAAKVLFADEAADYGFTAQQLIDVNSTIDAVAGLAPGDNQIGFVAHPNSEAVPDQAIQLVIRSETGTWFCIWDIASGSGTGINFGQAPNAAPTTLAGCSNNW